jgi:hypothetical protein
MSAQKTAIKPRQVKIEGHTAHGGHWRTFADMEGGQLGLIHLQIASHEQQLAICCSAADVEEIRSALGYVQTSIEWIQEHGLEPTYGAGSSDTPPSASAEGDQRGEA